MKSAANTINKTAALLLLKEMVELLKKGIEFLLSHFYINR